MKISRDQILKYILCLSGIIFLTSCSSASYSSDDSKMEKIENSKQYNDGEFINSTEKPKFGFFSMFPIMWDYLFVGNDRKPDEQLPIQQVDFSQIKNVDRDLLKVTWLGHSSQIINIDGKIILTDPIYKSRTAFMGPSRYNGEIPMEISELPDIDLVIISHNHYDHLNYWTIEQISKKVKKFVVPLMVGAELEDLGIPREKIIELDWWDEVEVFDDFLIVFTPTQHFSGRGMFDRDESLWGSYVLKGKHHSVYFSGDSGYFEGFKKIGEKYGPFDLTLMECGAYNPQWHYVHMFPEETAQAHLDLKGKILQPMHWGTFDLSIHSWYDPMVRISRAADSLGIHLSNPIVGETILINDSLTTERWWEKIIKANEENEVAKKIVEKKWVNQIGQQKIFLINLGK